MDDYIKPDKVVSPKAFWRGVSTLLDRGPGDCAYALGTWNGEPRIGFRWNGDGESGPLGNPQSRGLPIFVMLDPALHEAILDLVAADKRTMARDFLGLRSTEETREIRNAARQLHADRVEKVALGKAPCKIMDGARLVLHLVPYSAVSAASRLALPHLFESPEKFPPIATGGRPSLNVGSVRINFDGLLVGSNDSGLGEAQRAYVAVSQSGVLESVVKVSVGQENQFVELPKVLQIIIRYGRIYAGALRNAGAEPPYVLLASLQNVEGVRLLHDVIDLGAIPEDIPCAVLDAAILTFSDVAIETVPGTESEAATAFLSMLNHISHAAGLAVAPCFDPRGNYLWRDAALVR